MFDFFYEIKDMLFVSSLKKSSKKKDTRIDASRLLILFTFTINEIQFGKGDL